MINHGTPKRDNIITCNISVDFMSVELHHINRNTWIGGAIERRAKRILNLRERIKIQKEEIYNIYVLFAT
jgi:hypothetical protein